MNAIFLTLFVSLVLLIGMALLFAFLFSQHSHEQTDRLSLLPLQEDHVCNPTAPAEKGAVPVPTRKLT